MKWMNNSFTRFLKFTKIRIGNKRVFFFIILLSSRVLVKAYLYISGLIFGILFKALREGIIILRLCPWQSQKERDITWYQLDYGNQWVESIYFKGSHTYLLLSLFFFLLPSCNWLHKLVEELLLGLWYIVSHNHQVLARLMIK